MKIVYYCQHIWGIGHYFRTLEICRALAAFDVVLVTGGPEVPVELPDHVRSCRLPGLMTDRNYDGLFPTDPGRTLEEVRRERKKQLSALFEAEQPDGFIIELYPFGRKAFRFELDPILEEIRSGLYKSTRVICSLRDILVEKDDPVSYESRVVNALNRYFDALLIHADPGLVRLDRTFSRVGDIKIPVVYTGYITPQPPPDSRSKLRHQLGIAPDTHLIVASAGGGKAGIVLLEPLLASFEHLTLEQNVCMHVFTGPFMPEDEFERLAGQSNTRVKVKRFTSRFLPYLSAADLSVSMGGYNTCMNLLATGVRALIWPYPGDHEQVLRAERLADLGAAGVIKASDLRPERLARLMRQRLETSDRNPTRIDLDGAANTSRWLGVYLNQASKTGR